jgi:hypothetical protein
MISIRPLWAIFLGAILLLLFCNSASVTAGPLQTRLEQFPEWQSPPILKPAKGDLYYPSWMSGHWQVTSTLIDLAAPLAPVVVTPGFEASQKLLQKPVTFAVRFGPAPVLPITVAQSPFPVSTIRPLKTEIVADRDYNGMSLATALLGEHVIQAIKTDPQSPNRQVALFQNGQRLVTQISDRGVETPSKSEFISSELYQQFFSTEAQIYLNQVENTIAYHLRSTEPPRIEANQVTAIYLSPQDPDYFQAKVQPVTLYRYQLQFEKIN